LGRAINRAAAPIPGAVLLSKPNARLCSQCKGSRRLCGLPECPILVRVRQQLKLEKLRETKTLYSPTPPSVLVGEHGYPRVRAGVNLPALGSEEPRLFEDPGAWWGRLSLYDIIRLRAGLVFSYSVSHVRAAGKLGEAVQEAALSLKPVDSEAVFRRPPTPRLTFDPLLKPVGPSAPVEQLRVVGNPAIPRRVDQLVLDRVKASRALVELYEHGYDVYYLQRLLSAGVLGVEKRLVPTRWAITAVDKLLGDYLLGKLRDKPPLQGYEVYHSSYIGNRYTLVLMPRPWSMEMVEVWMPHSVWVPGEQAQVYTVHEWSDGRPSAEDGGYQAIRFAVLEELSKRGRQASVLAVREITPEYFAPVGNWQIREGVRNALRRGPLRASTLEEALEVAAGILLTPLREILSRSVLLRHLKVQRGLEEFLEA